MPQTPGTIRSPLAARWHAKVTKTDTCWLWTGAVGAGGYGIIRKGGRREPHLAAHRVGYELYVGPVPAGRELDHLCRTLLCVRPDHLEAVTHRVNMLRGISPTAANARKTTCPHGHPYTHRSARGTRRCYICERAGSR